MVWHIFRSLVTLWIAFLLAPTDSGLFVRGQVIFCSVCDTCGTEAPQQFFYVNGVQSDCKTPGALPARIPGSNMEINFGRLAVQGDLVSLVQAQWNTFATCEEPLINTARSSANASGYMRPVPSISVSRVPINTADVAAAIAAMAPGVYDFCRFQASGGGWYNTRIKVIIFLLFLFSSRRCSKKF
jgi:hypothetical protein